MHVSTIMLFGLGMHKHTMYNAPYSFLELAVYIMYICITYALNKNKAKGKDGRPVSGPKEGHFSLKKIVI